MAKSITATKKPRGRPITGVGTPVQVRLTAEDIEALDAWRRKQDDIPSRPEAVRRLLAPALKRKP